MTVESDWRSHPSPMNGGLFELVNTSGFSASHAMVAWGCDKSNLLDPPGSGSVTGEAARRWW
jgi:hypothetical protein